MESSIWVATTTGLPARRQARMISFCRPGTSSGGISTPRSPRATMAASASSTKPSRCSSAAGFSILIMTAARSPISLRASATSSGRCTKERPTQSVPNSRPISRSARSLSVRGEIGSTTPGTLTPLRSLSVPPVRTSVSAKSLPQSLILRRNLPSSSSRSMPGLSTANTSGWGRGARFAPPGVVSRSRRKPAPVARSTSPPLISPTRSLGPCRSMSTPIGRPTSRSTARTSSRLRRWSSCVP